MTFGSTFGRVLSPTFQPHSQAVGDSAIKKSLISWWSMDETDGTRYDVHGDNDLIDNNTVGYATGKKGNAASAVAGNVEYLSVADNASLSVAGTNFTWAFWLYYTQVGSAIGAIISKRETSANTEFQIIIRPSDKVLRATIFDGGGGSTFVSFGSKAMLTSTWYFVVLTYDYSSKVISLSTNNGTPETADVSAITIADGSAHLAMMNGWDGTHIAHYGTTGYLDEVGFWKRILTEGEITWLYNSGNGRAYSEL